jgi:bacillopeptidase F (M6 metalloprotease family)
VCRMCSGLVGVGCAAACAFLSATAGQAAIDTVEGTAQGRRKACRNAIHEIGAAAECGVQYAGHEIGATAEYDVQYAGHKIGATAEYDVQYASPIARSPGDASAGDQAHPAVLAPRGRAGIDPGLRSGWFRRRS